MPYTPEQWQTILAKAQAALHVNGQDQEALDTAHRATEALKASEMPGEPGRIASGVAGFGQEATLGLSDEMAGLGSSLAHPMSPVQSYQRGRDESRDYLAQAKKTNPKSFFAGSAIGALAPALATAGADVLPEASSLGARLATQVGRGAAYGAASGYGHGEGLVGGLEEAGKGALWGGAAGGTVGALGETGKVGTGLAKAAVSKITGARIPAMLGKAALFLGNKIAPEAEAGVPKLSLPQLVSKNTAAKAAQAIEEAPQVTETATKVLNQAESSAAKEATAAGKSSADQTVKRDFNENKNIKVKPGDEGETNIKTDLKSKDTQGTKGEKTSTSSLESKAKTEKQSEVFTETEIKKLPKEITPKIRDLQKRAAQARNQAIRFEKKLKAIKAKKAATQTDKAKAIGRVAGTESQVGKEIYDYASQK